MECGGKRSATPLWLNPGEHSGQIQQQSVTRIRRSRSTEKTSHETVCASCAPPGLAKAAWRAKPFPPHSTLQPATANLSKPPGTHFTHHLQTQTALWRIRSDISYVITDSKDEKRTTLKVKDFNPSTGEMTLAIPNTHTFEELNGGTLCPGPRTLASAGRGLGQSAFCAARCGTHFQLSPVSAEAVIPTSPATSGVNAIGSTH